MGRVCLAVVVAVGAATAQPIDVANVSRFGDAQRPCPSRPSWAACPRRPMMMGDHAERLLFTRVCTSAQAQGAESPIDRCHGVHSGPVRCGCCGAVLFDAADKCESGTGWPSFSDSLGVCIKATDGGSGEAVCARCVNPSPPPPPSPRRW
jgi:hypothetical protein